jgi:hypothetical protein
MFRRTFLALLIGLGLGALGGAVTGWLVPAQEVSANLSKLHPDYKAEYAVMVGAAYAVNGDWDLAQARLHRAAGRALHRQRAQPGRHPQPGSARLTLWLRHLAHGPLPPSQRRASKWRGG